MKIKLLALLSVLFSMLVFTSCQDQEAMGRALKGTWEGDLGITRTLRGKTIKPTRTVLHFNQDNDRSIIGDGYMIEYYGLPGLEAVYHHLTWDTWTRKNGNVGFEFKLNEIGEEYVFYDDWSMTDAWFEGTYPDKNGKDVHIKLNHITSTPDISNVRIWGYFDNMDTWHPVTYEGTIGIKRDYEGKKVYTPTKVTIVFDCDPVFNESNHYTDGYVIEHYADAPFGSYLADKIEYWGLYSETLTIRTSDRTEYNGYGVKVNSQELTGEFIISINETQQATLKRVDNPDMSSYTIWGIESRMHSSN